MVLPDNVTATPIKSTPSRETLRWVRDRPQCLQTIAAS